MGGFAGVVDSEAELGELLAGVWLEFMPAKRLPPVNIAPD